MNRKHDNNNTPTTTTTTNNNNKHNSTHISKQTAAPDLHHKISVFSDPDPGKS